LICARAVKVNAQHTQNLAITPFNLFMVATCQIFVRLNLVSPKNCRAQIRLLSA
jgi:hypothetical protein